MGELVVLLNMKKSESMVFLANWKDIEYKMLSTPRSTVSASLIRLHAYSLRLIQVTSGLMASSTRVLAHSDMPDECCTIE